MFSRILILILMIVASASVIAAQRIAILEPQKDEATNGVVRLLQAELSTKFHILDPELSLAAFRSVDVTDPFNLSSNVARHIGTVVGCDTYALFRTGIQRRAATDRPAYYEAFVVSYIVDTRSGLLLHWQLDNFESESAEQSLALLKRTVPTIAAGIGEKIKPPVAAITSPKFTQPPPEGSHQSSGLKMPIPYKRIKPEYTPTAFLYSVKATVDIEVDINIDGTVGSTQIVRWAGYGLDESVEKAVRSMNWRPAMRDGKPLPMRVLLRYNFKKIEKDEEP